MAKGFSFNLQGVLDWRAQAADRVQERLAAEERQLADINARIEFNRQAIREAFDEQQGQQQTTGGVNSFWQANFTQYIQTMRNQEAELQKGYSRQLQVVSRLRLELRQARLKQKSLEMLRDRQKSALMQKITKAEEDELAEIGQRQKSVF